MFFLETPVPVSDLDKPWVVSPGIEGFLMFLVLALAGWFLIASMLRHVRRANFRAAEREEEIYGPGPRTEGTGEGPVPGGERAPDTGMAIDHPDGPTGRPAG